MGPGQLLPTLLGLAVLLPLISFFLILLFGPKMGPGGKSAAQLATGAIGTSALLSFVSLAIWLGSHAPAGEDHAGAHHAEEHHDGDEHHGEEHHGEEHDGKEHGDDKHADTEARALPNALTVRGQDAGHEAAAAHEGHDEHHAEVPPHYAGEYYLPGIGAWVLGQFGELRISIGYYIDSLTISMFCMVTFIATLIHIYAMGYMHEELHEVTDHEVTLSDGSHLHRRGRYHRFFQYLSLFCFSMLGLVVAGNIAMVFVFWELVGICSYFLIGFYVERKSASNAANKAFIVNRVGDFGMILGLMALWTSLGTFNFGDVLIPVQDQQVAGSGQESADADEEEPEFETQQGIFSLVRQEANDYQIVTPAGMVEWSARKERAEIVRELGPDATDDEIQKAVAARIPEWRDGGDGEDDRHMGYGLLMLAGIGIFAGCVGKSAQFPLHVWLPDAMEGPTPVSALVHSATMVAAGVYLVARFFPVFVPEVLLVIAITGCITLFIAATIAITATDIKRVLAYSTISQLGYMMMALGVGAWVAGVMHLITHAFFKSLLFMCSGSVIHAVHSNEMTEMGGLRKKMPVTAYTMLVGCLAIAGAGIPFIMGFFGKPLKGLGFSGFYSKDAILEQAFSFMGSNGSAVAGVFFLLAAAGAAITAFYMFRLWYLTFAGTPRNQERYDHAHESPPTMYVPLVILSVMAVSVAWVPAQGILGGLVALILFLVLRFRSSTAESHGTDHAATAQHASGHEEHGHDDHGHDALPPWLPNLPAMLAGGVLVFAILWAIVANNVVLVNMLEQSRPVGTLTDAQGVLLDGWEWPNEHAAHEPGIVVPVSLIAIGTAFAGFMLATLMYGLRRLNPDEVRRQFNPIYVFLLNKWWFDELYDWMFVRPTHVISRAISGIDRRWIDRFIDGLAWGARSISTTWDRVADRTVVDGFVNTLARWTYATGVSFRVIQTGSLRQYIVFIVVGAVSIFILISFFWNPTLAG